MVAFVDDYVPIVTNTVVHNTFANEALDDGHIEQTGRCLSATADSTNRLCRYVQEGREPLDPLVEELPPMHEHQRAGFALCDQPGGNHRFPKAVVADRTPVSCFNIASAASFCSGRSSP